MRRVRRIAPHTTMRKVTAFIAALLLTFSQQVALTHAAWHAHHSQTAPQQGDDGKSLQGELCALHGAFTQVLGGLHTASAHVPLLHDLTAALAPRWAGCVSLARCVPLSRGPPTYS